MISAETPVTKLLSALRARSPWLQNETSRVFLLHWRRESVEAVEPFGGLLEAQAGLQRGLRVPMLVLGLPELAWVREVAPRFLPPRSQAWRVLDWPGLAYLSYVQLPDGLQSAYEAASAGATAPVPEGVVRDTGPLHRTLSDLRHLLIENRQKSSPGKKADFIQAREAGEPVSSFHLVPADAFDTAGREKLQRLWDLDDIACLVAPASGGLAKLKEAIDVFERHWGEFEQAKARIATATNEPARTSGLVDVIGQTDSVDSALTLVASRIDELLAELERIDVP